MDTITLKKNNIKKLEIEGFVFKIDCNDAEAIVALDNFSKSQAALEALSVEEMTSGCAPTIDAVLGSGAYAKLFGDKNKSVAPYYLCLDLLEIYQKEFLKDKKKQEDEAGKEQMATLKEMSENLKVFNQTMTLAQGRYGGGHAMAPRKRPAKKR